MVRRARGQSGRGGRFAVLDEVAAYAKVVRAALTAGLSPPSYWSSPALEMVRAAANDAVVGLLARLLDADDEAVPRDELAEMMTDLLEDDRREGCRRALFRHHSRPAGPSAQRP